MSDEAYRSLWLMRRQAEVGYSRSRINWYQMEDALDEVSRLHRLARLPDLPDTSTGPTSPFDLRW